MAGNRRSSSYDCFDSNRSFSTNTNFFAQRGLSTFQKFKLAGGYQKTNVWTEKKRGGRDDVNTLKEKHPREWAIFSSIDTNNDGYIDERELAKMCDQFGVGDLANAVGKLLDLDGSGKITFQELLAAFADIQALRVEARERYWNSCFGLGVAGNVAGHMAQAGEADQDAPEQTKPAAVFAFYVPKGSKERLLKNK